MQRPKLSVIYAFSFLFLFVNLRCLVLFCIFLLTVLWLALPLVVVLVAVLVFSIFCIIPNPLNSAKAADGGTRIYSPILPIYVIYDWNKVSIEPHSGLQGSESGESNGKTVMGKQIFIFGIEIYDGRYEVEGVHTR